MYGACNPDGQMAFFKDYFGSPDAEKLRVVDNIAHDYAPKPMEYVPLILMPMSSYALS
jgi:hypothetical protein